MYRKKNNSFTILQFNVENRRGKSNRKYRYIIYERKTSFYTVVRE